MQPLPDVPVEEVAEMLGVSRYAVTAWARQMGIGRWRLGRYWFNNGDIQKLAARAAWLRKKRDWLSLWVTENARLKGRV
jgi:predicted site-specific integrase-resolvase